MAFGKFQFCGRAWGRLVRGARKFSAWVRNIEGMIQIFKPELIVINYFSELHTIDSGYIFSCDEEKDRGQREIMVHGNKLALSAQS